jgi:RNA 2',3'-cyclic 3'-phosphodiesterase
MAIRSFLAFELPPGIKKEVAGISGEVKKTGLRASWVKPGNIHLTVIFLGDVNEQDTPGIISSIDNVIGKYKPFDISLGRMGVFPDIRKPRVLWLGLNGEIERLAALRDDLQKPLETFDVKQEKRSFKPHLTLGRFRKPVRDKSLLEKILGKYGDISGPDGKLDELILFKSVLNPGGSVYTKINTWPLENSKTGR